MKFKVFTLSVLISALISTSAFAAINITVDNKPLTTDVSPVIIDGRTLVPVRSIFEELGADVIWNNETKTVSATKGATNIEITLGSNNAYVNNNAVILDVPAQSVNGRTMVPARFVAEALGCNVNWDSANQLIQISSSKSTNNNNNVKNENSNNNSAKNTEQVQANDSGHPENAINTNEKTVYITANGKKYHSNPNCSNMKSPKAITLSKAESSGYTPCKKCS